MTGRKDTAGEKYLAVAIDGPSGAGKSTAAKLTAAAMGMTYIDTGAMYRAVALYNLRRGIDLKNKSDVEASLPDINILIGHKEGGQRLLLNGEDVTEELRTQRVAEASSVAASYEAVRTRLLSLQRELAANGDVVMDGRDIGTKVLPWAQVKVYLDASVDARVNRRVRELIGIGENPKPAVIRKEIEIRDKRDKNRAVSPLVQAADAVYLDSSDLSEEDVAGRIAALVREAKT